MLKVLAVIWFLVVGWPSSQARGVYQLPSALPLPEQNIFGSPSPYSFGYQTDSLDGGSAHRETSDGTGKVEGSYSLNVRDGRNRRVLYSADSTGFRATNEPGTQSHGPADVDFLSSTPQIVAGTGLDGNGGAPIQVSQSIKTGSAPSPYFFHYSIQAADGESSRQESSDGAGRVEGSYWMKVKDGRSRKVDYTADASGFKAKVDTSEPGTKSHYPADVSFHSSAAGSSVASDSVVRPPISSSLSSGTSGPALISFQLASDDRPAPSPYSFGYTIDGLDGGSSRQEWSDGSGNVKGSYSLKVKDGRSRKVDYTADAQGFKATVETNEPGTKSENPAEVSFLSSAPSLDSLADGSIADIPAPSTLPTSSAHPFRLASETKPAANPYSFAYSADGMDGGSSRTEWSDGSGKVKGNYSLKIKDGRRRKVDYTADAGGFRATVETNEPGTKNHFPAQISFLSSRPEGTATGTDRVWSVGDSGGGATREEQTGWPYNFDYSVEGADGASWRQEQSDGRGNVRGSYSFRLEDGRHRKVDYTADASGFKAKVDTNEPGTGSQSPAHLTFHSSAPTGPDLKSGAVGTIYQASAPLTYQKTAATSVWSGPTTSASPSADGFSYDGGHSQPQWSDGAGSYSSQVKDGRRKMEYPGFRAAADTGQFIPTWYSGGLPFPSAHQTTGLKSWL